MIEIVPICTPIVSDLPKIIAEKMRQQKLSEEKVDTLEKKKKD